MTGNTCSICAIGSTPAEGAIITNDIIHLSTHLAAVIRVEAEAVRGVLETMVRAMCMDGFFDDEEAADDHAADSHTAGIHPTDSQADDDHTANNHPTDDYEELTLEEAYEQGYQIGLRAGYFDAMEEMGHGCGSQNYGWESDPYDDEDYE